MSRILAISDIHGCYETFLELLDRLQLKKSDQLYLLGDFINRGPGSRQVIDTIMALQEKKYKVQAIKGNHEELLLESNQSRYDYPGRLETVESFGIDHLVDLDSKYQLWFQQLPNYVENDAYIFVHAGLDFSTLNPLDEQYQMLWIRDWYKGINYNWLGERKIIHGHTPIRQTQMTKMLSALDDCQVLDIDNGCFYTDVEGMGQLAAVDLTGRELVFQPNVDVLFNP